MNILITGSTGTVGKAFVLNLQKSKVNNLCLLVRDANKAISFFGNESNIEYVSVEEISKIREKSFDIVFHLAAYITSNDDEESMKKLIETNIGFSSQLLFNLQYCKGIKLFVNFGTFAEYRFGTSEINNAYLYSATKSAFKEILKYYADKTGYSYINIIPYTIYGGNDSSKKVIDYLKESLNSTEAVKMTNGEQRLDFIHLDDVVSFLCYIIENIDKILLKNHKNYFLGTGIGTSIKELAALLEEKYNKKCNIEWGARDYRPRDVMHAVAPIGNLLDIGWKVANRLEDQI